MIIITAIFVYYYIGFARDKLNISTGCGMPEFLKIALKQQLDQLQWGLGFGTIPIKDNSTISILGDVRYHFGGFSELPNRRLWFRRIGLNYFRLEDEIAIDKDL